MPWPPDHKARTRRRIVEAAAAAFRARGVAGVRLEDVMARAGLTHGGFYAHFESKDALLREAVEHADTETVARLSKPLERIPPGRRLQAVIDAYLSAAHAAHPEAGCPVAALGSELARGDSPARGTLAQGVRHRLAWMRGLLPEDRRGAVADERMIAVLACMVGGAILARTAAEEDSRAVLAACRTFLHDALERPAPRSSRTRRRTRRATRSGRDALVR